MLIINAPALCMAMTFVAGLFIGLGLSGRDIFFAGMAICLLGLAVYVFRQNGLQDLP